MAVNISIPSPISEAAEQQAQELGMSLDEFCVAAVRAYVAAHQNSSVTAALNRVYETEPSAMDPALAQIQRASVGEPW